jgi:leader peptidase (prepilin peptidase) / N-methyltransferase
VTVTALDIAIGAWVLAVGAAVGSFLNVVIARVPSGESVVSPRSRCPRCRAPIAWHDNLPVVSWILLRGRCRRCAAQIPARYLAVELLGAAAAFLAWQRHGLSATAAAELACVALLVALSFVDLATWLLPYALTLPLLGTGLVASALGRSAAPSLASSAAGAAGGFAAFALVAFLGKAIARKEAMGMGDVWLIAGIGAWLGIGALLPVVLLASIQGSVVGLLLVVLGRAQPGPAPGAPPPGEDDAWVPPRNAVPFGPFLALGAVQWLYLAGPLTAAVPVLDVFR